MVAGGVSTPSLSEPTDQRVRQRFLEVSILVKILLLLHLVTFWPPPLGPNFGSDFGSVFIDQAWGPKVDFWGFDSWSVLEPCFY